MIGDWFLGVRIEVRSRKLPQRTAKLRFFVTVEWEELRTKSGALRTFPTRERAIAEARAAIILGRREGRYLLPPPARAAE